MMAEPHRNTVAELTKKVRILVADPTVARLRTEMRSAGRASKAAGRMEKARAKQKEHVRKAETKFIEAGARVNFAGTESLMNASDEERVSNIMDARTAGIYNTEHQSMMMKEMLSLRNSYRKLQEIEEGAKKARSAMDGAATKVSTVQRELVEKSPGIQDSNHAVRAFLGFEPWSKSAAARASPDARRLRAVSGEQDKDARSVEKWEKKLKRLEPRQKSKDAKAKALLEKEHSRDPNPPRVDKIYYEHNGQRHYFEPNHWHPAPQRAEDLSRQINVLRLNIETGRARIGSRKAESSVLRGVVHANNPVPEGTGRARRTDSGISQERQREK